MFWSGERVIERNSLRFASTTILAVGVAIAASAADDPPGDADALEIDGSIRMGVQYLDLDGDKANFNQYRNVSKHFGLAAEEVMLRGDKGPYHFLVGWPDLNRDDDRSADSKAAATAGSESTSGGTRPAIISPMTFPSSERLQGDSYWAVPGHRSTDAGARFSARRNPPAVPTANGITNLLDLLDNAGQLDLDLVRKTGTVDLRYTPLQNFNLVVDYLHQRPRRLPADERRRLHARFRWRQPGRRRLAELHAYGLEFPEPIDYDTNEVRTGFDYRGTTWNANLGYRYVSFDNNIDSVTWDNPLRLERQQWHDVRHRTEPVGSVPGAPRHTVSRDGRHSGSPVQQPPHRHRVVGTTTQNADFLPYTVNDVLTVVGGPNDGVLAAGLGLPANDLNGQVDTILVNALLSSRPIDPLSLNFRVNYYNYDNESDRIAWVDGWARIGESVWSAPADAGVVNRVPEWERIRDHVDASYRVSEMLTLLADYTYEAYNRNDDRNASTDEHIVGGRIKLAPTDWSTLRLGYHWADQTIDGNYSPEPAEQFFEWDALRMFDQADRKQNKVDAYLSLNPIDRLAWDSRSTSSATSTIPTSMASRSATATCSVSMPGIRFLTAPRSSRTTAAAMTTRNRRTAASRTVLAADPLRSRRTIG